MNYFKYNNLLFIFFFYCFNFYAQKETSILKEIVTDNAHIFSISEKESLEKKLTTFEKETSNQIVVVTINSLDGETIEGYALNVFNKNKLGQKNADNGILILFSDLDKEVRIEVGYGLEPIITDALSSRIIREIMIPNFKNNQKFKGIDEASSKLITLINDPKLIEEFTRNSNNSQETEPSKVTFLGRIFGVLFLTPIMFLLGIFGYNKTIAKNDIYKKVNVKSLYKKDKVIFFSVLLLGALIIGFLMSFFLQIFFILFIVSFLSIFVLIGFKILLKQAFDRSKKIFVGLFTGKLGVMIFPFYLPFTILFFVAGLLFSCAPICMLIVFFVVGFLKENMNHYMSSIEPIYFLYILISLFITFMVVSIISAILEISEKKKKYVLTFFNNDIIIGTGFSDGRNSRSRSYSSGGSSYSSSSSSSSFSGGGGSSGGGGASGSW